MTAWWFQVWAHFLNMGFHGIPIDWRLFQFGCHQADKSGWWLLDSRFIRFIAHLNMLHFHIYYYLLLGGWNMMKHMFWFPSLPFLSIVIEAAKQKMDWNMPPSLRLKMVGKILRTSVARLPYMIMFYWVQLSQTCLFFPGIVCIGDWPREPMGDFESHPSWKLANGYSSHAFMFMSCECLYSLANPDLIWQPFNGDGVEYTSSP